MPHRQRPNWREMMSSAPDTHGVRQKIATQETGSPSPRTIGKINAIAAGWARPPSMDVLVKPRKRGI